MNRGPARRPRRPASAARNARERREYIASVAIVGATKAALGLALAVSAAQTYRVLGRDVVHAPMLLRGVVPPALLVGSLVSLLSAVRALREIQRARRAPIEAPSDDDPS